jgi:transcriptional regulator with XRE-family HTH domain
MAAERIGTTHATLSRIERGKLAFNDSTLEAIAGAYNVSPADLLVRDPSDPEGLVGNIIFWATFCVIGQPFGSVFIYFFKSQNLISID